MIRQVHGNILDADAEALVNTVNCVGVMGRGIALQFKEAFPDNYKAYKAACNRREVRIGRMFVYEIPGSVKPRYIINFPSKRHWREKSRLEDIEVGLKALVAEVRARRITTIAIPPLGCGLGGLRWSIVRPMIVEAFKALPDLQVLLYEPDGPLARNGAMEHRPKPRMTRGRAAMIKLMAVYLEAAMDVSVSLLELHKLLYFVQEAGEPLRLRYAKGPYGPYAENLRHVLRHVEGHYTRGYSDATDSPGKQINLLPNAIHQAMKTLESHPDTLRRVNRVADLIEGFETPYGMELLSTVYWVVRMENARSLDEVAEKTYSWNSHKKMFDKKHLMSALEVLREKKWIHI